MLPFLASKNCATLKDKIIWSELTFLTGLDFHQIYFLSDPWETGSSKIVGFKVMMVEKLKWQCGSAVAGFVWRHRGNQSSAFLLLHKLTALCACTPTPKRSQWILDCFPRQLVLWDTRQCWGWRYGLEVLGACRSTCSKWNHWRLTLFCEILMRLEAAKMSFESNPSSSSPSSSSSSCPFDALFSGVVSVHSMLPELHNLKLEVSLTM